MRYRSNARHILGGCSLRTSEKLGVVTVRGVVSVVKWNTEIYNQTITSWWRSNDFHREETTKLTSRVWAIHRGLTLKTSVL